MGISLSYNNISAKHTIGQYHHNTISILGQVYLGMKVLKWYIIQTVLKHEYVLKGQFTGISLILSKVKTHGNLQGTYGS
jgi:hypothetical protein